MNGSQARARTAAVLAMSLAALVWTVVGTMTLFALPMSLMAFDAPGSENNPWIYAMIAGWALVPLLSLISVPVMSTEPPATGLPEMGSISNCVSDRTVSLNTDELVGSKLDDPLKKNCIWTIPRG